LIEEGSDPTILKKTTSKSNLLTEFLYNPDDNVGTVAQSDQELLVKKYLKKYIKGWRKLKKQDIFLKRLAGLSNVVYLARANGSWLEEGNLDRPKHVIAKLKRPCPIGEGNVFNPYTESIQNFVENVCNVGPKNLYEDHVVKFQEFIYNSAIGRTDMCLQNYRLWMMQPASNFTKMTQGVKKEEYGGKIHLYHLLEDKHILSALKARMEGYNMRREEILTLVGALECLQAPEEQFVLSLFKNFPQDELCVAHGDCYYLNTLYDHKNKDLCFIDFEYSG
jgi:hypothetical protein